MKKMLFASLLLVMVTACSSGEPQPTFTLVPQTDTIAPPITTPLPPTPLPPTPDETAGWPEYINSELGYAFKYPVGCFTGPIGADCKENPPEQRPPECLCFLDTENPNEVILQSFLGNAEEGLTLVTFYVAHFDTPAFNPPEGENLPSWLKNHFSYFSEEIPTESNLNLGGLPAVRIYIPGSQQSYPSEEIFVIRDGKLINIRLINVDVEEHRELYENILVTFKFSE